MTSFQIAFALRVHLDFFIQVCFYPELCFVLVPALNLLLSYPYFIFPLKVSEFFPLETSLVNLYIFFKSHNAVSQNFRRIWVWAFFHSLHWDPHGPVQFWNSLSFFSLGIFSCFFFDDFFFPISLFFIFSFSFLFVGPPRLVFFVSCLYFIFLFSFHFCSSHKKYFYCLLFSLQVHFMFLLLYV